MVSPTRSVWNLMNTQMKGSSSVPFLDRNGADGRPTKAYKPVKEGSIFFFHLPSHFLLPLFSPPTHFSLANSNTCYHFNFHVWAKTIKTLSLGVSYSLILWPAFQQHYEMLLMGNLKNFQALHVSSSKLFLFPVSSSQARWLPFFLSLHS